MSDDKLIRLSDAITALRSADLPFGYGHAAEVIRAIPAVQPTAPPGVQALVEALYKLDVGEGWAAQIARAALAASGRTYICADRPELVALVHSAEKLLEAYSAIFGTGNPWGDELRAALAAWEALK